LQGLNTNNMKKITVLALGFMVAVGLSGCIKDRETFDPQAQYQIEKPIIEEYATTELSNPQFHEETGIWYQILNPGESGSYEYKIVNNQIEAPTITVKYSGWLLNGTKFDENQTDAGFKRSLGGVITAWQIAFLPQEIDGEDIGGLTVEGLQVGSKIRIVTPSYLAYGNQSSGNIPANSPLDFEIEVLDIVAP